MSNALGLTDIIHPRSNGNATPPLDVMHDEPLQRQGRISSIAARRNEEPTVTSGTPNNASGKCSQAPLTEEYCQTLSPAPTEPILQSMLCFGDDSQEDEYTLEPQSPAGFILSARDTSVASPRLADTLYSYPLTPPATIATPQSTRHSRHSRLLSSPFTPFSCDDGTSLLPAQYTRTPRIDITQIPEQEHERSARVVRALRWLLCLLTIYPQLTETPSPVDDARKAVHDRLQKEWIYCGGMLVGIASLDMAVLVIPGHPVDSFVQKSMALSAMPGTIGVFFSAWFLFFYRDYHPFQHRIKDVFGSHVCFAIIAKLPSLCLCISSCTAMAGLWRLSYNSSQTASLVISIVVGTTFSLQLFTFGVHLPVPKWIKR